MEGKGVNASEIQRRTKVARTTLDRILDVSETLPDQRTLDLIAKALGAEAPRLVARLEWGKRPEPATAMDWLGEAGTAIERAKKLLSRDGPEPTTPSEAARAAADYDQAEKEVEAAESRAKAGRRRPRGK